MAVYRIGDAPGYYFLLSDEFKADVGVTYKLSIKLRDESAYESEWASMPVMPSPEMGQISFREVEIQKYVVESDEEVLRTAKGIWSNIEVPENTTSEPVYYKWSYTPHWIYVAPLASSISPGHTCWATNPLSVRETRYYSIELESTTRRRYVIISLCKIFDSDYSACFDRGFLLFLERNAGTE